MGYCSVQEVVHEFTPTLRLNMERDYGSAFEEVIAGHIEKAHAFVEASLARSYSVPLKQAANVVVSAECKIAAYFSAIAYSEKDDIVKDKFESATVMLDYLVEADNPALVDEGLSNEELDMAGVLYGSDQRLLSQDEIDKW